MEDVKIVGIAGYPRSGKDSLGDQFIDAGYYGVSFGDIIRGYARERHADKPDPISVENMTETANWLRNKHGADVLLQEALRRFKKEQASGKNHAGLLFISVRAPVEADFIEQLGGELIWVEASDDVRYSRDKMHRREGEIDVSFEEFKRQENLQTLPQPGLPEEAQMNMTYVKSKATRVVENNGDDYEAFKQAGRELVRQLA